MKYTIKNALVLIIYLLINGLFVLKYGSRQNFISHYFLLFIYVSVVCFGLFLLSKKEKFINNIKKFNHYFLALSLIVFIVFVVINIYVDGEMLKVDRWSALEVSAKSVLHLEYPYDKLDHLQGTSSNLPALIYLGIPFYLLGDVGLLQPFVFGLIIFTLLKLKITPYKKTFFLFLLLMSSAYLWEVSAKSDLMSNLFLVALFMAVWNFKFKNNYFEKPVLLAVIISFLVLTRGIVFIPLTLFLFKPFIAIPLKNKTIFVLSLALSIIFFSLPILISLPDKETLLQHNPFNNQTIHSPMWIMIATVLVPFIVSLKIKKFKEVLQTSFLILSIMLFYLFFANAVEEGFDNNLYKTLFDISYLGMILPFAIFSFVENLESKLNL